MRKEAIMKTAEKLFFEMGYAETSIQDILDALSISKGGFYHYFDSKNALLEEICRERSARDIERIRAELFSGKFSPVQKLNLLLGALHLFNREDARFVADLVEQRFPNLNGKVVINSVGTTIGSHTGPGTVALFFWGGKREN